jgi:molecular chaperone GrpE
MLQRTLFRASRQASRQLPRPQAAFAPITRQASAIRWYSEQPAATKEGESNGAQQSSQQSDESTQLKEQLQKKDKEIVDLKVRFLATHGFRISSVFNVGIRTSISAP